MQIGQESIEERLCGLPWQKHETLGNEMKSTVFVRWLHTEANLSVFQVLDANQALFDYRISDEDLLKEFSRQNNDFELEIPASKLSEHISKLFFSSSVTVDDYSKSSITLKMEDLFSWKMSMSICNDLKSLLLPLASAIFTLSKRETDLLKMVQDRDFELKEYRAQFGQDLKHYCRRKCTEFQEDTFSKSSHHFAETIDQIVSESVELLPRFSNRLPAFNNKNDVITPEKVGETSKTDDSPAKIFKIETTSPTSSTTSAVHIKQEATPSKTRLRKKKPL